MRASHLATALTAFAAGLSAATVLHRRAERPAADRRRRRAGRSGAGGRQEPDGVVLPFLRTAAPPAPAPPRPAAGTAAA